MKALQRAAACLMMVAAVLVGVVVTAPVAGAASPPSCRGTSCEGMDPAATNCVEDATTILSRAARTEAGNFGHLELRYSPKCHSNWVRFTPWHGVQAWLGNLTAEAEVNGQPWIWRYGVANSLRGPVGHSSFAGAGVTTWTAMITADGTTCSSVEVYETEMSQFGGGDRRSLGTYNAPCIS